MGSLLVFILIFNVSILHNDCRRLFDYVLPLCYYYHPRCQYLHRGICNNPHNHRLPLHYLSASVYFHLSGLLYLVRALLASAHRSYCASKLTYLLYSSSTVWSEWSSSSSSTPASPVYTSSTAWVGWTSTAATVYPSTTAAAVSTYAPAAWNATTPAYATFTGAANQVVAQAGAGLAAIAGVAAYLL
jgi:hypothetical protein